MNTLIDGLVRTLGRFFGWMFGTRNGWIFFGIVTFMVMMKFQPEMLAQLVSNTCAWIINLIGRIIQANQPALEKLFCIILLCFGIVMMLKSAFKKSNSSKK